MRESSVQNHIRNAASELGDILWRNNTGVLLDKRGVPVRFGLCNDTKQLNEVCKSSDLIGPTSVFVTPQMVGTRIAVFTAVEVKEEGWEFNPNDKREVAQKVFIDLVARVGGFSGFAQSIGDYKRIIGK